MGSRPKTKSVICCASSTNRKHKRSKGASVSGFGAATKSSKRKNTQKASIIPTLSTEAQELLDKHHNNIDAASQDYFESRMSGRTQQKDELSHGLTDQDITEFLDRMAAKWDTVALFLPLDYQRNKGKVEPYVQRRLQHICHACCQNTMNHHDNPGSVGLGSCTRSILDVGCGDAAIYKHLVKATTEELHYWGQDVSSVMIDMAIQKHGSSNANFCVEVGSFPQHLPNATSTQNPFNCVLFNGSLQFFHDPLQTLKQAATILNRNPVAATRRIVVSHVNGAKFVRSECRTNADVAVSHLPSFEQLQELVANDEDFKGWKVVAQETLVRSSALMLRKDAESSDLNPDSFYLVALEKGASNQ